MEQTVTLATPLMQFGFAGFALLQIAINVWLFKGMLSMAKDNNASRDRHSKALDRLTNVTENIDSKGSDGMRLLREVNDKLLARPCLLDK